MYIFIVFFIFFWNLSPKSFTEIYESAKNSCLEAKLKQRPNKIHNHAPNPYLDTSSPSPFKAAPQSGISFDLDLPVV